MRGGATLTRDVRMIKTEDKTPTELKTTNNRHRNGKDGGHVPGSHTNEAFAEEPEVSEPLLI